MLVVPYFNWIVLPIAFFNIVTFGLTKDFAPVLEKVLELDEKIIGQLSATKLGLLTFGKLIGGSVCFY